MKLLGLATLSLLMQDNGHWWHAVIQSANIWHSSAMACSVNKNIMDYANYDNLPTMTYVFGLG